MPEVGRGAGRLLVAVYAVFALVGLLARRLQLATASTGRPWRTCCRRWRRGSTWSRRWRCARGARRLACARCCSSWSACCVVGTLIVVDADLFPDQTVWSAYGAGYGFIPLVLPVLGLWRLHATR